MADLTISTLDVLGEPTPAVKVIVEPTDENGARMAVYQNGAPVVATARGETNTDGELVLDLVPQASLSPDPSYYTVWIGTQSWLIVKGAAEESLLEAMIGEPTPAGSALTLSKLQDVDPTGAAAGKALAYDTDGVTVVPLAIPTVADVTGKVDADGGTLLSDLDADGNRVVGLADGDTDTDAATVRQVATKDDRYQGRQNTPATKGWDAGLDRAIAGDRLARVLVIADSVHERVFGSIPLFSLAFLDPPVETVWSRLQAAISSEPAGFDWPPSNNMVPWPTNEGTVGEWGIDRRGRTLAVGDQTGTNAALALWCRRLRFSYTAHTAGCDVVIEIDGEEVATIDTSLLADQSTPATGVHPRQVWESDVLSDSKHWWMLTAAGTGTARIETAKGLPLTGLDVSGAGISGQGMDELLAAGTVPAVVEQMVADGEPPDLIVYATDAGDGLTAAQIVANLETIDGLLRAEAVDASAAYQVGYDGSAQVDWANTVPVLRRACADLNMIPLDLSAPIESLKVGEDPFGFDSGDGFRIHLSPWGARRMWQVYWDALGSRIAVSDAGVLAEPVRRGSILPVERLHIDDHLTNGTASTLPGWTVVALLGGTLGLSITETFDTIDHYLGMYHLTAASAAGTGAIQSVTQKGLRTTLDDTSELAVEFWLRLNAMTEAGEQYINYFGLSAESGQGALFDVRHGETNYRAMLDTSSESAVYVDTGVAVDLSWHRFRIEIKAGFVVWLIDDVKVAELPLTSSLVSVRPLIVMYKTVGTASRTVKWDRFIYDMVSPFQAT